MHCRSAGIADIPSIQAVAEGAWLATYRGILSDTEIRARLADWYSAESLTRVCTDPNSLFLVAIDDEQVVGYGHYGQHKRGPQLFRLYAVPNRWRSGVGSAILDHLEVELQKLGVAEYCCQVHRLNEVGRSFYKRRGFEHDPQGDDEEHYCLIRRLEH